MSADYDRLFHSSEAAQPEEETATVDREPVAPAPTSPKHGDTSSVALPVIPPTQAAPAPAPSLHATEVTTQMPVARTGAQRMQNGLMRAPQGATPTGARYEQRPAAPAPQAPSTSAPVPSPQHYAEPQASWTAAQQAPSQPMPT